LALLSFLSLGLLFRRLSVLPLRQRGNDGFLVVTAYYFSVYQQYRHAFSGQALVLATPLFRSLYIVFLIWHLLLRQQGAGFFAVWAPVGRIQRDLAVAKVRRWRKLIQQASPFHGKQDT
jgi:hypothetical protein